jgi:uncharacterized protein (DUF2384 family)
MTVDQHLRYGNRAANIRYIAELAAKLLGPHRGVAWLSQGRPELDGRAPIDELETDDGVRRVEALLQQQAAGSAL